MCLWRRSQVFVMNPARGEDWRWSSYRCYLFGEPGPVGLSKGWDEFRFDPARRENPIVRTDCYPPFAKRTVQSHDILYTLSRDILYTPARAQHARGWQERWHGRRWMFTSNASGSWWRPRKKCSPSARCVPPMRSRVRRDTCGCGATRSWAYRGSRNRVASRITAHAERLASWNNR